MLLFHANVQIFNDSTRTIYMIVESHASNETITPVRPHALEPGYSHLYSIPQAEPSALITVTLGEDENDISTEDKEE